MACDCFSDEYCDFACPYGQALDPRHFCRCIDEADKDALYICKLPEPEESDEEEEEEETCPAGYTGENYSLLPPLPPPPPKIECSIECPKDNEYIRADFDKCECVCEIECNAAEKYDVVNCACIRIEEEEEEEEEIHAPTGEFKCDSYGKKQCLDVDPQCAEGEFWNEDSCLCF